MKRQMGAATLLVASVMMTLSTLIVIFAANYGRLQQKSIANVNHNYQAFSAAEAGIEYGVTYLQANSNTVLASPVAGYINYSIGPVTLANNASYTITYTNPTANNYDTLRISVTGTSNDGSATHIISQNMQSASILQFVPTVSLQTKGMVRLKKDAVIRNTVTNQNIQSASTITILHDAKTVTNSGTSSTSSVLGSDVQQNNTTLAAASEGDFIATYFGTNDINAIKNQSANVYTSGSSVVDYSSTLNGMTGTTIFIDATGGKAKIKQNTVIGSATNPVLLVVDGKAKITGNTIIYGFVFVIDGSDDDDVEDSDGEGTLTKDAQIIGGFATTDNVKITKQANLTYDETVLNNLRNQSAMKYFARIPGSWKDF